ncbi:hypothetical protein HK405_003317 [Cladochytrium tenue]|nr:hypothetical protein HK405_003317 [Cladochytrium tenue]
MHPVRARAGGGGSGGGGGGSFDSGSGGSSTCGADPLPGFGVSALGTTVGPTSAADPAAFAVVTGGNRQRPPPPPLTAGVAAPLSAAVAGPHARSGAGRAPHSTLHSVATATPPPAAAPAAEQLVLDPTDPFALETPVTMPTAGSRRRRTATAPSPSTAPQAVFDPDYFSRSLRNAIYGTEAELQQGVGLAASFGPFAYPASQILGVSQRQQQQQQQFSSPIASADHQRAQQQLSNLLFAGAAAQPGGIAAHLAGSNNDDDAALPSAPFLSASAPSAYPGAIPVSLGLFSSLGGGDSGRALDTGINFAQLATSVHQSPLHAHLHRASAAADRPNKSLTVTTAGVAAAAAAAAGVGIAPSLASSVGTSGGGGPLLSSVGSSPLSASPASSRRPALFSVSATDSSLTRRTLGSLQSMVADESDSKPANTVDDRRRRRRESHNAIERRRRDIINEKIQEISFLLPNIDTEAQSKGEVLRRSVEYTKMIQALASRQQERILELELACQVLLQRCGLQEQDLDLTVPLGTVFELPQIPGVTAPGPLPLHTPPLLGAAGPGAAADASPVALLGSADSTAAAAAAAFTFPQFMSPQGDVLMEP